MTTLEVEEDALRVASVSFSDENFSVALEDGRTITAPLWWYPRLANADARQRENWAIMPFGDAIEWEAIDEHISVKGLLQGGPAPGATPPGRR